MAFKLIQYITMYGMSTIYPKITSTKTKATEKYNSQIYNSNKTLQIHLRKKNVKAAISNILGVIKKNS